MAYEEKTPERPANVIPKPIVKFDNYVRKQTQAVDVSTLNEQGVTRVNFLTLRKINELISTAVQRAFEKYQRNWNQAEAQEIQARAQEELKQHLSLGARSIESMEAGGKGIEEEVGALRPLVESQMAALGGVDSPLDPEVEAASGAGFRQIEERMRAAVAGFLAEEERQRGQGLPGGPDLKGFARGLETAIGVVMEAERARLLALLNQVFSQKTALLERRLTKLKGHLKALEEAHQKLSEEKWIDPGIPSIYREIQGLSLTDNQFEKKKDILKVIFEDNLELQKAAHDEP
jgi:hypothetical protein